MEKNYRGVLNPHFTFYRAPYLVKFEPGRLGELVSVCVHQRKRRPEDKQAWCTQRGEQKDKSSQTSSVAIQWEGNMQYAPNTNVNLHATASPPSTTTYFSWMSSSSSSTSTMAPASVTRARAACWQSYAKWGPKVSHYITYVIGTSIQLEQHNPGR